MRITWISWNEKIRQSYWVVPALMSVSAVGLTYLSLHYERPLSGWLSDVPWFFTRDPQGARDLLGMVGGSLITVTGVIFSVTLVALTNASSQYGTRILTTFARDLGNKIVLGTFVGTFLYAVLVMRTITESDGGYVPHFAVFVAVLLSMVAFGVLIYFIHHLVEILQSDNVVAALVEDLQGTVVRMFPTRFGKSPKQREHSKPNDLETNSAPVCARKSGYIESVDSDAVMKLASEHDIVIWIKKRPGDFIVSGGEIAAIYPAQKSTEEIEAGVASAFEAGKRRTYVQDVGFGFEQLQLVAIRALSPAVNNQILGMGCIDRILEALVCVAERDIPSGLRADEQQRLRVIACPITHSEAVHVAFDLVAEASRTSPVTTMHIIDGVGKIWNQVQSNEMRDTLYELARNLRDAALQDASTEAIRAQLRQALARLEEKRDGQVAA